VGLGRYIRRVALLARVPRLGRFGRLDEPWPDDWPVVGPDDGAAYPALADDFRLWHEQLERRFRRLDHQAQLLQNQFWRQHLALIVGGLVATGLGAAQAATGGGLRWLAVAQAVLAGLLAGLTVVVRSRRAQHGYLDARLKAERVKSEFFLFLGRVGAYGDEARRVPALLAQVDDIEAAEGGR